MKRTLESNSSTVSTEVRRDFWKMLGRQTHVAAKLEVFYDCAYEYKYEYDMIDMIHKYFYDYI